MKTYKHLERGRIIQTRSNGGTIAIVLEHRPDSPVRLPHYTIYQMGFGERIILPEDIESVGPMLSTVKLHAAKVEE